MDLDPWSWNVSDVQQFFRQDAIRFIADRPSGQLPPLNDFVQALGDNDVDGASLLDTVDTRALREDFAISSFRHRGSIIHCIRKLQNLSRAYPTRGVSPQPQTPTSLVATPLPPPASGTPNALSSTDAVGENVRQGETRVEDGHGRKRRKLDLFISDAVLQPAQVTKVKEDAGCYLPDAAVPVDELFYGATSFGHVIGELSPEGSVLVDDHDPETADDNFQFTSQHKRVGEAKFVYSHIRHFLHNREEVTVRRRGKDAVAIMPYRDGKQLQARSATVLQAGMDDEYIAIREQASLLESGLDYSGEKQESTGEWDWVLQKHKQKEGEKEVSVWGDSDDDDEGTVTAVDSEESKGPEADEEMDEQSFDKLRISEVMDAEIGQYIAKWQEKLPRLEEKRAWSIWKKTKGSRTLRDTLIEGANARIADFTRRLNRLREDLLDREFSSEQSVQRACLNLGPTIEDREEYRWKILVWQRKQEPAHTIHHRAKQNASALQTPATGEGAQGKAAPGFVLHPDDRMSVSPTPAMHVDMDAGAVPGADDDGDGDEFHTPDGSPVISPTADLDGFEASDEMSLDQDHEEQDMSSDQEGQEPSTQPEEQIRSSRQGSPVPSWELPELPEADAVLDEITISPPRLHSADSSAEEQMTENRDVRLTDPGTSINPWVCPTCSLPVTPDEYSVNAHVDDCLSRKAVQDFNDAERRAFEAAGSAGSDDELPSAASLIKVKRAPESPARPRVGGPSTQPITISSDSAAPSSPPAPKARKGKGKGKALPKKHAMLSRDPEKATAAEVDSWEYQDLSRFSDRARILIKLIRDMNPQHREDLHLSLLKVGYQKDQAEQLCAAARAQESGDSEAAGLGPENAKMMLSCARLAISWWVSDPKYFLENDIREAPWSQLYNDRTGQVALFLGKLVHLLKQKGGALFSGPKTNQAPGLSKRKKSDGTIEITSDSEEKHSTPHKQRKRLIKESQSAVKSRSNALLRQEQYTQKMASQHTDSSRLAAMIASDPSNSEIDINPARAEGHDPIFIHPRIAVKMKPHQIEGVRFMWREITAPDDDDEEGPQGCLLAHTMGLGKTMQAISLLVAVAEASQSREPAIRQQLPPHLRPDGIRNKRQLRMLILCPPALLQNWQREIEQWAPDAIGHVTTIEASSKIPSIQLLEDWYRLGGVLLIGYNLFRSLVKRKDGKYSDDAASRLDEMLLDGPEIVVADEAHNLKSATADITQVANAIKTHTRIALTGTPMSNDVQEIYALVSWVAPGYLGEPAQFRANYAEPIEQGTYAESTRYEKRKSLMKLTVLQDQIQPKVNRADITALRGSLKPKVEFVITVPLTEIQESVYRKYIVALLGGGHNEEASQVTIFSWLAILGLLTNHPAAFKRKLLTKPTPKKAKKLTTREVTPSEAGSNAPSAVDSETTAQQLMDAEAEAGEAYGDQDVFALGFTEGMVQEILRDVDDHIDPALSAKITIFLDILQLSHKCGDKVLVFSSSIPTLQYLSDLLDEQRIRFGRIDGSVLVPKRMQLIEDFHSDDFEVMLVSTKAGGVGLNIQGANRVVIMDFGFNPAWEEQAIGRAYRLGQTKPVFVYRFLAGGTFESNLWNKQLFKRSLTNRVVDKKNTKRTAQRNTREYLHNPTAVPQEDLSKWIRDRKDPMVLDKILTQHGKASSMIRTILTTETLQEEVQDEPLDDEERKEVDDEIKQGKTRLRGRKVATTQNGYLAAKSSMAQVHPAATQAGRTQVQPPRPSASQRIPARFQVSSTAPVPAADRSPLGGLPFYTPGGNQRHHGHPTH